MENATAASGTQFVQPRTLGEVKKEILNWFGAVFGNAPSPVRFSMEGNSSGSIRWRANRDINLKTHGAVLEFKVKQSRLDIDLSLFDVEMEFGKDRITVWIFESKARVFARRWQNLGRRIQEECPSDKIEKAASAPDDYLTALCALQAAPSFAGNGRGDDPLSAARLRGLERRRRLVDAAGGLLNAASAAEILGVTRQAVDKRRVRNRLLAITQGKRGFGYPAFQFDDGRTLAGLDRSLDALQGLDTWMQLVFFAEPNDRLGGKRPLESLREGQVDAVMRAAQAFGQQGAA